MVWLPAVADWRSDADDPTDAPAVGGTLSGGAAAAVGDAVCAVDGERPHQLRCGGVSSGFGPAGTVHL